MHLDLLCCARVLLVLFVYDGIALLQAGAVQPHDIGLDIAREFLLFEVIVLSCYMLMFVLISQGCFLVALTFASVGAAVAQIGVADSDAAALLRL